MTTRYNNKKKATPLERTTICDTGSFVFKDYKIHENIKSTIQNWQLRNLLSCANTDTIVHPFRDHLHFYNPKLQKDVSVINGLPFEPTTLDAGYGYVALAGHRGMALIKDQNSDWATIFKAGLGMNNSIHLSRNRVTICNNDHSVIVYAVPSMQKIVSLNMPAAINQVAVSPDGRWMLAVSDEGLVYLYHINTQDEYTLMSTLRASDEAALACAWNPSSELFAVTTQDGFVSVWDAQSLKRLARLGSAEPRKNRNAGRSIQFSKGPLDLLAYAEHVNHVNIIDTRTFETRQIVRLGSADRDVHIAGLTFSADGESIFVALESDLVQIKIDSPSRRRFASSRVHMF